MRSGQKGGVENIHTMLRMVLPKGTSFEYLTQWDVNLIVNHINSTPRKNLDGKTPYDAALESFSENTLKALQLKRISPDEVNLMHKLIPVARLPCPEIGFFIRSQTNYSRHLESLR